MPSTRDLEAAAALVDMSTQFVPTKVRLRLNTPRPSQAVFTAPTLRSGLTLPMHPDEQAQDVSLNDSQASERPRKRAHGELDDEPSTSAYAGQMPKAGASISANSKHPGTPTTRQPLKGLRVKAVARPTKNRATPRAWLEYEKAATITLMRRVVGEFPTNFTEWRFEEISKRLMSRFGVDRSAKSVKNFWNREGRQRSGLDERKKPRPEQMATGVQDPATRRFYRQLNVQERSRTTKMSKKPKKSKTTPSTHVDKASARLTRSNASNMPATGSVQHRRLPCVKTDEHSQKMPEAHEPETCELNNPPVKDENTSTARGPKMGIFKLPKNTVKDSEASSISKGVFNQISFDAFKRMWTQYSTNKTGSSITTTNIPEYLISKLLSAYDPVKVLFAMKFDSGDFASKQYAISIAMTNFHRFCVNVLKDGGDPTGMGPEDDEGLCKLFEGVCKAITNAGWIALPAN